MNHDMVGFAILWIMSFRYFIKHSKILFTSVSHVELTDFTVIRLYTSVLMWCKTQYICHCHSYFEILNGFINLYVYFRSKDGKRCSRKVKLKMTKDEKNKNGNRNWPAKNLLLPVKCCILTSNCNLFFIYCMKFFPEIAMKLIQCSWFIVIRCTNLSSLVDGVQIVRVLINI